LIVRWNLPTRIEGMRKVIELGFQSNIKVDFRNFFLQ